ncbi:CoA pyrophosphatase [Thalassobius sp. S69A]|uniref:CoA pyrophosphatase n=1 Tax=unclassified Thalassovita TaxID=2619711 RepID=UPI000C0FD979|nr:CoA pyrophosphatase [Paracoccaceae bacterium]MBT27033.1 CoA pyrophosphatase [Paracoccaceae bacterium]
MPDPYRGIKQALTRPSSSSSDFDLNPDFKLPAGRKLRPAGVLAAFVDIKQEPHLILTKRASHLKHHPGQIAFPGGKQDDTDVDVVAAALREAHEEVGLHPRSVEVLGTLPAHETVTSFTVTPVLARVTGAFDPVPEPGEVDEIFYVPLSHVTDPRRYSIQGRRWRGVRRHYYTVAYGPYYIWGATARILRGLADRMNG